MPVEIHCSFFAEALWARVSLSVSILLLFLLIMLKIDLTSFTLDLKSSSFYYFTLLTLSAIEIRVLFCFASYINERKPTIALGTNHGLTFNIFKKSIIKLKYKEQHQPK